MTKSKTYEVTSRTDEVGKVNHKAQLKAVQESEDGSDKESIYEVPLPPDGGWGWVVMIASFFINLIVDGVCYTFGVIFNGLLVSFGASETLTALVGSLVPGMYLIAGPIVSILATRFGCRNVAVVGSIMAAGSFFASSFSNSIIMMLITYGIMGGIGFGLMYLPSIVMVGYYFDKKRALATGIAVCGSGIGTFVFAPLGSFLVEEYGWRGCNIIISGIILNGVAFSMCFRALTIEKKNIISESEIKYRRSHGGSDGDNLKTKRRISECSASDGAIITDENEVMNAPGDGAGDSAIPTVAIIKPLIGSTTKIASSRISLHHSRASLKSHQERQTDVENPMLRKDALLVGSHRNLDEYKEARGDVEEFTKKMVKEDELNYTKAEQVKRFLVKMFDFSLLKSLTFMLLAFSGVLVFAGLYTPFVFVAQKAINDLGIHESKANLLLSILGACNTVSRIITGFISDLPRVDVIVIQNVAAILAGTATCLVPFLDSYVLLAIYAAFFGVTIAAFIALRSIVMVEMLGLQKLNNAFGLTALFQGIAVLVGSPMSGALYNSTGSYLLSFLVCGVLIALGGVICIPVRAISRWEKKKADEVSNGKKHNQSSMKSPSDAHIKVDVRDEPIAEV